MSYDVFRRGTYVGDDRRLQGKEALLLPSQEGSLYVMAQFDDRELPEAIGWSRFPVTYFEEEETVQ
jgi:hypothetical protein